MAILRSFSKDYGMAGNWIAYIISHPEIIIKVKNKAQWANVSYLSVGAATTALDHENYFVDLRAGVIQRREDFIIFLQKAGYTVLPSKINAILVRFNSEQEGIEFNEFLNKNNFFVSPGNGNSNIGLDKSFVRISVGNEEQMNLLKDVIRQYKKTTPRDNLP